MMCLRIWGEIMSVYQAIQEYLKKTKIELKDVDESLRRSIVLEIEGHLKEKFDDAKQSSKTGKLSSKKIQIILKEFGEPKEIAQEYHRQLLEEHESTGGSEKPGRKRMIIPILLFIIVILIIIIGLFYISMNYENDEKGLGDNTIIEGKGLESIQIDDSYSTITKRLGDPEGEVETDTTIWVKYNKKHKIDFLLAKNTETIIEIRFNEGYEGSLENGIKVGSSLDRVLNASGGTNRVVDANLTETAGSVFGSDKVLYNKTIDEKIISYKFIDSKKGILFWFNTDREVTQIVVFKPF
jgi:hypothetical protein